MAAVVVRIVVHVVYSVIVIIQLVNSAYWTHFFKQLSEPAVFLFLIDFYST